MQIGIDGRSLQDRPWSGVGQYAYGLLRALFELDRENEYVVWYNAFGTSPRTVLNGQKGQSLGGFPTFSEYPNVHVYRTHWPNKVLNMGIKALHAPKLEIRNWKLDILLMPNLNFIALPSRTKLVLTVHDLSFEHFPEHFSFKTRLWHKIVNPRALVKRASKVVAVSAHTKDDLVETYGIAPEKVTVVYPGIRQVLGVRDLPAQAGQVSALKPKTSNLTPNPYILYFGALEPRKNIEGLIGAFEQLNAPSPRVGEGRGEGLVIAGLSTPYVARLKRRIAKSPLRERITLIENPTEEQKHALYSGATLFVYPSFYEGFGFPPLEAMAAGVPVVASSAASVPEVCGDAAVLVSPWKVEEIKQGMRVLLEDEAVRTRYIEAGRRRVAEFSWQSCAKQILDIFGRSSTLKVGGTQ